MGKRITAAPAKKMVWRITAAAPSGELVEASSIKPTVVGRPEASEGGGWAASSFDLLHGSEVSENPETVPDALFDEWFAAPKTPPAPTGTE